MKTPKTRKGNFYRVLKVIAIVVPSVAIHVTLFIIYAYNYTPSFAYDFRSDFLTYKEPINVVVCDTFYNRKYFFLYCEENKAFSIYDSSNSDVEVDEEIARIIRIGETKFIKGQNSNELIIVNENDTLHYEFEIAENGRLDKGIKINK